jgi:hypothetical protein
MLYEIRSYLFDPTLFEEYKKWAREVATTRARTKEALSRPHGTVIDPEEAQIEILNQTLKHAIVKELQSSAQTV